MNQPPTLGEVLAALADANAITAAPDVILETLAVNGWHQGDRVIEPSLVNWKSLARRQATHHETEPRRQ